MLLPVFHCNKYRDVIKTLSTFKQVLQYPMFAQNPAVIMMEEFSKFYGQKYKALQWFL